MKQHQQKHSFKSAFVLFGDCLEAGADIRIGILRVPIAIGVKAMRIEVDLKRGAGVKLFSSIHITGS